MERGTLIADRYELTERLGRGGMGEVWSGRDRHLHRTVAIKLLQRDADAPPELIQRFEREAVAAAQVSHPNIVALHDRGTYDGLHYLVMEHVAGESLAQHLHRQGRLRVDRALEIAQQICAALVAAHRANVVHYDIKPSNVMLTADGALKVVDFGIAGFTHTHTFTVAPTTMLSPVGTAQYGAPEQFLDQRGDARSDLYALGSVLFALLTGEPPFAGGSPLSVIRRKLDEDARPVTGVRPEVPEPVAELIAELLRREPGQRPETAAEVARRLAELRGAPVPDATRETEPLGPPPRTEPLTHPAPAPEPAPSPDPDPAPGRKRTRLLTAAAIAVALIAGITSYALAGNDNDGDPGSGTDPSTSPAPAPAKFLRMPDLCDYLSRNDFRGSTEMAADELDEITNNRQEANCGWKGNHFELEISAFRHYDQAAAVKDMRGLRRSGHSDLGGTTYSEVKKDRPGQDAVRSVSDESRTRGLRRNSTTVTFRRENLFIEVRYEESDMPELQTDAKERATFLAEKYGRILDSYLTDEPENHEKPNWGRPR